MWHRPAETGDRDWAFPSAMNNYKAANINEATVSKDWATSRVGLRTWGKGNTGSEGHCPLACCPGALFIWGSGEKPDSECSKGVSGIWFFVVTAVRECPSQLLRPPASFLRGPVHPQNGSTANLPGLPTSWTSSLPSEKSLCF